MTEKDLATTRTICSECDDCFNCKLLGSDVCDRINYETGSQPKNLTNDDMTKLVGNNTSEANSQKDYIILAKLLREIFTNIEFDIDDMYCNKTPRDNSGLKDIISMSKNITEYVNKKETALCRETVN